jgi:hypothetical protein
MDIATGPAFPRLLCRPCLVLSWQRGHTYSVRGQQHELAICFPPFIRLREQDPASTVSLGHAMSVQDPGSVVITDLSQPRSCPIFWSKDSPIKHAETCDGATHERLVQP